MKIILSICLAILVNTNLLFAEKERFYQEKFNNEIAHGQLEVVLPHGRADIINDVYAIEVDFAKKWKEGIEQCLRYAADTGKKPGLVLIVDNTISDMVNLTKAKTVCFLMDIELWTVKKEGDKK